MCFRVTITSFQHMFIQSHFRRWSGSVIKSCVCTSRGENSILPLWDASSCRIYEKRYKPHAKIMTYKSWDLVHKTSVVLSAFQTIHTHINTRQITESWWNISLKIVTTHALKNWQVRRFRTLHKSDLNMIALESCLLCYRQVFKKHQKSKCRFPHWTRTLRQNLSKKLVSHSL